MVKCILCSQELGRITHTHLWHKHKIHFPQFRKRFPNVNIGPLPWHKGETKETNPGILKLSNTLKRQKEWNFSKWQKERNKNLIPYKELIKDDNLAELIGIILGDGNLYKHLRTENLRIICNSKDIAYIRHIVHLITKIFSKNPSVIKRKNENATVVCLYQCEVSKRLDLPCGNKIKNNCARLRKDAYNILLKLGFNPQLGSNYVRLARKNEVYRLKELIDFRNYN